MLVVGESSSSGALGVSRCFLLLGHGYRTDPPTGCRGWNPGKRETVRRFVE